MLKKYMKGFCLVLEVLLLTTLFAHPNFSTRVLADDPKARAIMEKVNAREDGDNRSSDMEMILIDKNDRRRIRKMRSFSKDKGDDVMTIMFFLSPADVMGTSFLTYDYDNADKDDDQWLFLPALHKTKRIATSDKSGSFMGSDFSYADMTKRSLEDYDFTIIRESEVNGKGVWVIQTIPRSKKIVDRDGYEKSVVFVRKDNYVVIRGISWLKEKNRLKYYDVKKLERIDDIWTITEVFMTTKKAKRATHRTILRITNVKYNQDLEKSFFTVRQMEKGL